MPVLSNRVLQRWTSVLPGNLRGQGAVGLGVGGLALFAVALSLLETVAAVALRIDATVTLKPGSADDPLYEAGTSLGFYAAILFALNFVLATRRPWVERIVGGADLVYALHGFVGRTVLLFVLLHTGIVVLQAIPDGDLVARYLVPGRDWGYTLGLVGTFGTLALVAVTIWITVPYGRWLSSHRFMIVPFVGGILHAIVLQVDWYMVLILLIGIVAWFDSVVLLPKRGVGATISKARTLGKIREIVLSPDHPFKPLPGQFVLLGYDGSRHPFSVSGFDGRGGIRLSAQVRGAFTRGLAGRSPGTPVTLYGPYGRFGSDALGGDGAQLWIAGGIGITPFLAMLQSTETSRLRDVHLIWSVRAEADAVYREELEGAIGAIPGGRFTLHVSGSAGRLEPGRHVVPGRSPRVLLCGPPEMTDDMIRKLRAAGVADHQMLAECFALR